MNEFYRRVAKREGLDVETVRIDAPAVMTALSREAVDPDELDDVMAQLPKDFDTFFRYEDRSRALPGFGLYSSCPLRYNTRGNRTGEGGVYMPNNIISLLIGAIVIVVLIIVLSRLL